jgi:Ca-activated chloride channel family protein
VAIDVSGSMRSDGKIDFVRQGLKLMLDNLRPGDEVTLVAYSSNAHVIAEAVQEEDWDDLKGTIDDLAAGGGTTLNAGLELAFEMVQRRAGAEVQNRVILLSDGEPTVGVTDEGAILEMASSFTLEGIGLTTVGVGAESNPAFLRVLSETGAGNFYFLESQSAIEEVFVEELNYFVTPIATDLRVEIRTGQAYGLREMFGTKLWSAEGNGGVIEIPSVQVAHRMAHDDQEQGRRGGGGAILLEMMPLRGWEDVVGADGDRGQVAEVHMSYLPAGEVIRQEQTIQIRYPLDPGEMPDDGFFQILSQAENPEQYRGSIEKAFVMLNLYAGFRLATESVERGDLDTALVTLEALEGAANEWHDANHDEDIEDDLDILSRFIRNLLSAGAGQPDDEVEPADPWPQD